MAWTKKKLQTPKMVALAARAAYEPMIAQHFGSQGQVVEEFERTVEWHVSAGSSQIVAPGFVILCLSLKKKV
jgi:jasmonate O-methyltransferase